MVGQQRRYFSHHPRGERRITAAGVARGAALGGRRNIVAGQQEGRPKAGGEAPVGVTVDGDRQQRDAPAAEEAQRRAGARHRQREPFARDRVARLGHEPDRPSLAMQRAVDAAEHRHARRHLVARAQEDLVASRRHAQEARDLRLGHVDQPEQPVAVEAVGGHPADAGLPGALPRHERRDEHARPPDAEPVPLVMIRDDDERPLGWDVLRPDGARRRPVAGELPLAVRAQIATPHEGKRQQPPEDEPEREPITLHRVPLHCPWPEVAIPAPRARAARIAVPTPFRQGRLHHSR